MANALSNESGVPDKPVKSTVKLTKVPGAGKIRAKELTPFTRQLAAMYSAGLPVVQSLNALEDQTPNENFKMVIGSLREHIEAGGTMSEGCAKFPEIFDDLFVHMCSAGEAGGILAETLERMASFLESSQKLKSKVKSALMYPLIVTVIAILLTVSMIIFIVPVFADIYKDFDAKLPGPTQFLVNISDLMRHHGLPVVAVIVIAAICFVRWKKTDSGALSWDGFILKLPVFGDILLKVSLSRFASTFAQLSRSGVPILKALNIVAYAMGNKRLGLVIKQGAEVVERGEPLSKALKDSNVYPPMLIHMLSAGEQSGSVDDMLDNIADLYEDEVQNTLNGLTSLIEPLLIVFLGIVVGGIVICMFMPIFQMHKIVDF